MIELRGITWQHTRGYLPMVATAQRFQELYPNVHIHWEMRSLQSFADQSILRLAETFDFLVIDHPFAGRAARGDVLLPLDEFLEPGILEDQEVNAVGLSYESYRYGGHVWALPTDTATPVSGARVDLLAKHSLHKPNTWSELLELARQGLVVLPAIPIDSLMHFYMLCEGLGEEPFRNCDVVASECVGACALEMLHNLVSLCDPKCLERNPIATWELMSSTDKAAYCPFAYGYSNYARPGYAKSPIDFGGLITIDGREKCRSTLGGAGLAISLHVGDVEVAARYAAFVASADIQKGIYFDAGGQPGHRAAWIDSEVNRRSDGFFESTLETLDAAFMRPRFDVYPAFQDEAGLIVHAYLVSGGDSAEVSKELNALLRYVRSRSLEVSQ
jgi:multiple sugar transport system substrate-binding protein